ncbi:hypothetical protein Bca52824_002696 [Brassica carinata]|uniref:Uncharacterized protein n=1 Tax=Brassica carinata TaxID=52824 RepID=A0A8X7WJP9_BRACI|nr:hypothetical protein Bca52824_002696 [Brassica carinata]
MGTWIGDQSIFTEEVKALKHDDPEAARMKQYWSQNQRKRARYKGGIEVSYVQQQKGQRGFHKGSVQRLDSA